MINFFLTKELNKIYPICFFYNADVSSAGVCGNATRCSAYLDHEQDKINEIQVSINDGNLHFF